MTAATLSELLRQRLDLPDIAIVDVGANPLTGKAPYQPLLDAGAASVVGFEPAPEAFAELQAAKGPRETYLPIAVGDGGRHTLRLCQMSGMNSLLAPNFALLDLLHLHPHWAKVEGTLEIDTVRLDDVSEIAAMDYLKIDIQGGELMVFDNAATKLKDCLVVHTEAMFVPMYEGQPLFSEQELALRAHGLAVHRFIEMTGHAMKPFVSKGNPIGPLSQVFWSDVVFIKDLTLPEALSPEQLLKLAVILNDVYRSVDAAHLFLAAHDRRQGTALAGAFLDWLARPQAAAQS